MRPIPLLQRHPSLRWLVPLASLGLVVALLAEGVTSSNNDSALPVVSVSSLVAQVRAATSSFSGAVVADFSDGAGALAAVSPTASLASLPSSAHSLYVWYGGPKRQRVAVIGALAETDVFRVGDDLWQWSSADRVAVRTKVPAFAGTIASMATLPASLTPVDLARDALDASDIGTSVSLAGAERVADRPVYGLVLRPDSANSLVDYVYIAVDGATKTPLAVQVYARGSSDPAIDVEFTDIRFAEQAASTFHFAPPVGATVRDETTAPAHVSVTTHGSGWTTVLCVKGAAVNEARLPDVSATAVQPSKVTGGWGKGKLVQTPLMSVLETNDGRVFAGAVAPDVLYRAAKA